MRLAPDEDFALTPWTVPPSRRTSEPPISGPIPPTLDVILADQIYIPKADLPPSLRNRLIRLAAFQNPEFHRAQAMRLPTYDKPRIIACAEDYPAHIALPRGCLEDLQTLLGKLHIRLKVRDERQPGTQLDVRFTATLRPEQEAAALAMLAHDTGVLAATTAFGKTVLTAWLIARRGVNTLVLVHRQQLMEQWFERLATFLDLPAKSIGRLGGGRRKLTGTLDIALIQSLVRKGTVDDRVADYGHLVIDECHHLPARSFELVARRAQSRYVTGLSATVTRKDGHHPIIFMQCGPIRHRVEARQQADARPFTHHVIVRPTAFRPLDDPSDDARVEFQRLCDALVHDEARNALIHADVTQALAERRVPLVLTERTAHLDILAASLGTTGVPIIQLRGGLGKKQLHHALTQLRDLPASTPRVILATGRFIGEGFDDPRLETLFLAMPVSWRGTITQYVGRLHRLHDGKREVRVHDYADLDIPMLSRMFDRRCVGYEAAGYTILLPASAPPPGWPVETLLPVEPEWKRDYAGSVRRLIRDGVDRPLANLFLHATQPHPGPDHARSASEAFLHRRLETLPATRGRFRLNTRLPIPFDQEGRMEVDFYCEEAHLAIELDGPQHLANEDAWRRDRRKDALLQRHGILILRFLATDVCKDLATILDTIQAALANRHTTAKISAR